MYKVVVKFRDADNDVRTRTYYNGQANLASLAVEIINHLEALDALTDAKIDSVEVTQILDLDLSAATLKANPVANSDVEIQAHMAYMVVGGYNHALNIPAFKKNTLTVAGGLVDAANAAIVAFNESYLTTGAWRDYRGTDVNLFVGGYETFNG